MISRKKIILYFGFAGVLPAFFFIVQEIYLGEAKQFDLAFFVEKIINLALSYVITASVSASVIYSITYLDKLLPWEKGVWNRIVVEFFYTNTVAIAAITIINNITYVAGLTEYSYKEHILLGIIIAIILNMFLSTFYEGIRLFSKWKTSLVESERLAKESMTSKFEALKNQINPHFLFNSLNTLSALIYSDTEKAEVFIDEFASIYRYILDNRDRFVVSLKEEIDFIKSFVYLLKIRFGDGLVFNIHIDSELLKHNLPTLSLQLLVENAIKHNIVSTDHPLEVSIYNENNSIIVKNNLQPRDEEIDSIGIGIVNLKERYKLLSDLEPRFEIANEHYIAKLPLIQSE